MPRSSEPRFEITFGSVSVFADRLRLVAFDDLNRFHIGVDAAERDDPSAMTISVDLPKKDRAAYEKAIAAFNMILDEHERSQGRVRFASTSNVTPPLRLVETADA